MATKIWNFFLPETGSHQLRIDRIGDPGQQVFIDGQLQQPTEAFMFIGPANALLEVRRCKDTQMWSLLVNGHFVEDYNPNRRATGDESLRELRGRPDGSYIIAPSFEIPDLEKIVVRKFRFKAGHDEHEVQVAHSDCVWQVVVDGQLVSRERHLMKDNAGDVSFNVQVASQTHLPAVMQMGWNAKERKWQYTLNVNNVDVPAHWILGKPIMPHCDPVVVLADVPAPPPSPECVFSEVVLPEPLVAETGLLPQGVSFDAAAGTYQATIRNTAGKFIFLGAFRTAEEAHQKYLEAMPLHCPDKHLFPEVPS